MDEGPDPFRLVAIRLDEASIGRGPPDAEHERAVAIYDLVEENSFRPIGQPPGPYSLVLSIVDKRLVFDVRSANGAPLVTHVLSLTPFRKIVKDYFLVCESYHAAIRTGAPSRIEAIDLGRRGMHDEASELLRERLRGKIDVDFDTARRLFTLICALHRRG
ncbi:UPF0262 family protein [Propylenella binzhouense]|uniref:UPF0262 protein E4O86_03660 n=1 Tax=Propylenella binzhouense TaxID=2555902 RepID=A0A964T1N8_9HYPH|nr:UPF0262 family protein [Propylenella binzhouense]MYZ46811.1 UPF0262 family protein [Propylenella binzhouense]